MLLGLLSLGFLMPLAPTVSASGCRSNCITAYLYIVFSNQPNGGSFYLWNGGIHYRGPIERVNPYEIVETLNIHPGTYVVSWSAVDGTTYCKGTQTIDFTPGLEGLLIC
jgi:hypothetical protein